MKDPDGIYLSCNPTFEKFFGAEEKSIVGKTDYDFVDKELADSFRTYDQKAMQRGKPSINEEQLTFSTDGYQGLFETIKTPMKTPDGKLIGILGIARDITERKKAEEILEKSNVIIESSSDPIITTNIDGLITLWNSGAESLYGYKREEVLGKSINIIYKDEDLPVLEGIIGELLNGKDLKNLEVTCIDKNQNDLNILLSLTTMKDKDGNVIELVGFTKDITEKRQLELKLQHAQKMESIGKLAGGIAHDFNNILYPIIGFTQLSQNELPKEHPVQENLSDILDGAKRASDLVKRILHFSRQKEPELKPVILQPVIKETQKLLRSTIPSNIDLLLNLYNGQDAVLCDESKIQEIILNLCTNAYHALAGEKGQIIINFDRQNPPTDLNLSREEYLCLSVTDNGIGIPERIKDKIFEPYVTTKDVGKGSGLGLSVVYGIVQNCKGGIRVESNPKTGTVFEIYLPITNQAVAEGNEHSLYISEQQGNEHILFVDDEIPVVKLGVRALKKSGYRVTGINNSREALKAFSSNPSAYDLVITDMAMPGMVGSELSREVLKIRPDIPIIICSGYSERLENEKRKDLNVSALLDKPLSIDDLAKVTREVLDNYHM